MRRAFMDHSEFTNLNLPLPASIVTYCRFHDISVRYGFGDDSNHREEHIPFVIAIELFEPSNKTR